MTRSGSRRGRAINSSTVPPSADSLNAQLWLQSLTNEEYALTPDPIPPKARYIGNGTKGSEVITGVLLHQTRYPAESECAFRFSKLEVMCALDAAAAETTQNLQRASLDPFGQDPVFNSLSALYDPSVNGKVGDYYNATAGAGEVASTGYPFAFYHRPVRGADDGFPVVFQVRPHVLAWQPAVCN